MNSGIGQSRYLVVGADSLIGGALVQRLSAAGKSVAATTRRRSGTAASIHLDLAEYADASAIPEDVSTAFLLAGITSISACEADPEVSRRVNVTGTPALARDLVSRGVHVVFASTNLVFDGSMPFAPPHHPVSPRSAYATQKAEAETALLATSRASVLRLSKVAETLHPLLTQWATDLAAGRTIHPFADRKCAPVSLDTVLDALILVGERRQPGIYQLCGTRDFTYAEIASRLAAHMGVAVNAIQPVTSPEAASAAAHTTIETSGLFAGSFTGRAEDALDPLFRSVMAHLSQP